MTNQDTQKLAAYCQKFLNLGNIQLGTEYGYSNLPLCIIDAIFSIGVRYESTTKVVERFTDYFNIGKQFSVQEFVDLYTQHSVEFMTEKVYNNRQRTSSTNGILKAEAVLHIAKVLLKHGANHLTDMDTVINNRAFETDFKNVRGQSSGVSLKYFYMLTGVEAEIKPDRMVVRFIGDALNRPVTVKECHQLLVDTCELLTDEYPDLTPRALDHAIWLFQRKR